MTFPLKLKLSLFILVLLILVFGFGTAGFAKQDTAETQSTVRGGTTLFSEDFSGYTGSGFAPMPAAGQLDSDTYQLLGMSSGDLLFGGTGTSGDFARGASTGGESTGGAYAFDVGSGNVAFGIQPGGSDFTPGSFDIRLNNDTGAVITEFNIAYTIWVFNDQPRGNSINFEWSSDGVNYTPVPDLDFTTPEAADGSPAWTDTARLATINGLNIAIDADFFLRWSSDDVSGSGSRDEFALDDIQVTTGGVVSDPIELMLQAPATATAGDQVTYTISITNPSTTDPLNNLIVTSTLPTGLSYASDTSGVTPVQNGSDVEWSLGTLAFSGTISFDLIVDSDTSILNNTVLTNQLTADATLNGSPVSETTSASTTFENSGPVEIFQIQGEGARSPFAPPSGNDPGDTVTTEDNVVTAVAGNGFFIQMPDDRDSSSLPLASRGLFVFTGAAPSVAVGDRVDVTGPVAEFFNLTQIANPDSVNVLTNGNPLPVAVTLDATLPSSDPSSLSCGTTQFECYENMYVTLPDGFVTAPSQSFGSAPVAEAFIGANGQRILRGEGAEFPGIVGCAGCPVWSGAPELFEMDPGRFSLRTEPLIGGTTFNATGVMGFSFGDYVFWPTELNIISEPTLPDAVADFGAGAVTIGSLNALNLFDDVEGPPRAITACGSTDNAVDRETLSTTDYATKLNKLATYIVTGLGGPDVLAVQEVESALVLQDLADEIAVLDPALVYSPRLEFGNDRGNINNGYLINEARVAIDAIEQLAEEECLSVDNSPLHDRPPLLLRGRFIGDGKNWPFAVYNNHLRSLGGIANPDGRTRLKRHEQAQSTARLVQNLQTSEPELPIIVIGDLNAFQFSDGYADVVGHLRGTAVPAQNLVSQENAAVMGFDDSNIPSPPLTLPLLDLPESERYSFIFNGVSQTLDHVLLNTDAVDEFLGQEYSRANADYWEGFEFDVMTEAYSSDHDGLVVSFSADTLFSDGFEGN